jgi:cell cycle arrest protein BUB3
MAKRHVWVYNLPDLVSAPAAAPGAAAEVPRSERESALKLLTGSVACMADGKGWASGSLEGRIAVEYFDPSPEAQAGRYAFRAHRQAIDGVDHAFPICALAYHPM